MKDFRLALVQSSFKVNGDIDSNLSIMDQWLEKGKASGADLAVFPEATLTGYLLNPDRIRDTAVAASDKILHDAAQLSKKHSIYYTFGFYERSGNSIYNSYAVAGNGRILGIYRKIHIPPREKGLFSPGSEFKVIELPFARIGLSICYDNEFPESHTCLALLGAELIIMPSGWADHWEREDYIEPCNSDEGVIIERERWMRMMFGARCRDTGTYSVLVNHSGQEDQGPSRFAGKSMIFAPTGKTVAEAKAWDDHLVIASIDSGLLEDYRNMDAFVLKSRNPSAYSPLTEEQERKQDEC